MFAGAAGLVAQAEAHQVGRDEAEAAAAESRDHLAPQKRPGGVAVHQEDQRAVAFVHEVDAGAADVGHATAKGHLAGDEARERRRIGERDRHDAPRSLGRRATTLNPIAGASDSL